MIVEEINYFKQFDIKFSTLRIGLHEYKIEINKTFFQKHENDEIKDADVEILLKVNKQETMIIFDFDMKGFLTLSCDVCLEDINYPIQTKEELIVKLSQQHRESDDENIAYISPNEHTYNIEQYIYEVLYALVPMRKTHMDLNQACNELMIQYIEKANQETNREPDPRWEALKEIKL